MADPVSIGSLVAGKALPLAIKILPQVIKVAQKRLPLFKFMSALGIDGKLESFRDIYNQSLLDFGREGKHALLLKLLEKGSVYDSFHRELYESNQECVLLELNAQIALDPELSFLKGELIVEEIDELRQVLASNIQRSRNPREVEAANQINYMVQLLQAVHQNVVIAPAETLQINHTKYIEQIASLRASNKHHSVIELLLKLKMEEWDNFNDEMKFKVGLNLGVSYLELHETTLAAPHLIDLLQFDYKREEAYAFAAFGYAYQNDIQQARHYAKLALQYNPDAANAYLVLLGSEEVVTPQSVGTIVPQAMLKHPQVGYAMGRALEGGGYMTEALQYYQEALEISIPGNSLRYHLMAGIAGLKLYPYSDRDFGLQVTLAEEDRAQIRQAIDLLNEAWAYYKNTDLRTTQWFVLLNRGIAYRCAGNMQEAKADFLMALGVKEHFDIYRNLQVLTEYTGEDAASYLQQMAKVAQSPAERMEVVFYESLYLCRAGRYDEALKAIETIDTYTDWDIEHKFRLLQVDCMIRLNKLTDARNLAEQLVAAHPKKSVPYYFRALIFDAQSDRGRTLENIILAIQYSTQQDQNPFLGNYYQLLYKYEDYESIIQHIDKQTLTARFSILMKILLRALLKSGNHKRAEELASALYKTHPDVSFLADVLSYLQEYHCHWEDALSTVNAYLSIEASDVFFRFKSASILVKLSRYEDAAHVLEGISWKELQCLSLREQFSIAAAYIKAGRIDKAFDLAYRVRGAYLHDLQAHEAYIYFSVGYREMQNNPSIAPETVEEGCYVTYAAENGEPDTVLITRTPSGLNDVTPESRIGAALLGRKLDEETSLVKEKVRVLAIVTKYSHAFHESLKQLTRRAMEGEMSILSFPAKEGDDVLRTIRPMFDLLDKKEDIDKQGDGLYLQRKATIGSIASICGMRPIQYWGKLVSDPDLGVLCTLDHQSAIEGLSALMSKQPVLVDLIALLTLHQIDAVELLSHLKGRCYIVQRVLDEIQAEIIRLKEDIEEDTRAVAKIKGHYRSIVTPSALKKKWVARYQHTVELVREYCEVVYPDYPDNVKIKEENDRRFGISFNETLLVSQQRNYLLYSDDALLVELAQKAHPLKGVSTVLLFQYLKTHLGVIDAQQREDGHVELIRLNYRWVPVNSSTLYKVYDLSGFELSRVFKNACKVFNGYDDRISAAIISEFLCQVYANSQLGGKRDFVAQYVVRTYLNRPGEVSKRVLLSHLEANFVLMPLQLKRIRQIVDSFE